MRCHLHPNSQLRSIGTYEAAGATRRRYRCVPKGGGDVHSFSVVEGQGARAWSPPLPCPDHAGSKVVRNGTYGVRTPRPRQRYRCVPADGSKPHSETCDEALTHRHGDTSDGWPELRAKRGHLAGRLTRLRSRLSTELDEDGNPIPVRRHHPDAPRRVRGRRFSLDR